MATSFSWSQRKTSTLQLYTVNLKESTQKRRDAIGFFDPLFMGSMLNVFIRRESELRESRSVPPPYVRFPQRISKFPKNLPSGPTWEKPPHLPPSKEKQQTQTKHEVSTTVFDINVSSLWILCDLCALLSSAVSWNCQSTFWCFTWSVWICSWMVHRWSVLVVAGVIWTGRSNSELGSYSCQHYHHL